MIALARYRIPPSSSPHSTFLTHEDIKNISLFKWYSKKSMYHILKLKIHLTFASSLALYSYKKNERSKYTKEVKEATHTSMS